MFNSLTGNEPSFSFFFFFFFFHSSTEKDEQQEDSKLRSGTKGIVSLVERSLSSRFRDTPDWILYHACVAGDAAAAAVCLENAQSPHGQ